MRTKQNPLHLAGPGASPARRPLAKLKAERVQLQAQPLARLKAERVQLQARPLARLKAERVQLQARLASRRTAAQRGLARVRGLPDWYAVGGWLGRLRMLANPSAAAAYACYVLQAAAQAGQCVAVELAGSGVTVAVRGTPRHGLTQEARDFARALA